MKEKAVYCIRKYENQIHLCGFLREHMIKSEPFSFSENDLLRIGYNASTTMLACNLFAR